MNTDLYVVACSGPGAYTPQEPQSPSKKHRPPEVSNPSATTAIAALQAKLRSSRRAACIEASAVEEVVRASLKHGTVEVRPNTAIMPISHIMLPEVCICLFCTCNYVHYHHETVYVYTYVQGFLTLNVCHSCHETTMQETRHVITAVWPVYQLLSLVASSVLHHMCSGRAAWPTAACSRGAAPCMCRGCVADSFVCMHSYTCEIVAASVRKPVRFLQLDCTCITICCKFCCFNGSLCCHRQDCSIGLLVCYILHTCCSH